MNLADELNIKFYYQQDQRAFSFSKSLLIFQESMEKKFVVCHIIKHKSRYRQSNYSHQRSFEHAIRYELFHPLTTSSRDESTERKTQSWQLNVVEFRCQCWALSRLEKEPLLWVIFSWPSQFSTWSHKTNFVHPSRMLSFRKEKNLIIISENQISFDILRSFLHDDVLEKKVI